MKAKRIDIAGIRREQIVDAAVAVIVEKGLQNLSLSEIEKKVGMARGQLMYYFKAKEDILLAVFDRLLKLMYRQQGFSEEQPVQPMRDWLKLFQVILEYILRQPPANRGFHALQFTFLSQISHRDDFRIRLAKLYEEWRTGMAASISGDLHACPGRPRVSPRALATVAQALLHGIAVQMAADPKAVDAKEIVKLCLDILGTYLWPAAPVKRRSTTPRKDRTTQPSRNGARLHANGVYR
jgi:AcrR family transcriptional regulator